MARQEPIRRFTSPEAVLNARPARAIVSSDLSVIPQEHSTMVRHFDQKDLAVRWNISARTLERWRWVGEGPLFVKLGGRVRYRIEDVEAFEARQLRDSTSAAPDTPYARSLNTNRGDSPRASAAPTAREPHGHDAVS